MNSEQLPYQLYLRGVDVDERNDVVPFEEVGHHSSPASALTALLKIDPRSFHQGVTCRSLPARTFASAVIKTATANDPLFFIMTISFNDSPEGLPAAGIYLVRDDELDWEELSRDSSISFDDFPYYDPECPHVLLAPMTYEDKLIIVPTDALIALQAKLSVNRTFDVVVQQQRKFEPSAKEYPANFHCDIFHFSSSAEAMAHLLRQNMIAMDEDVARYHQLEGMINEMDLVSPSGERLLSVVTYRHFESTEQNGIYFYCHKAIAQHADLASVAPAGFGNDDRAAARVKIFHFTPAGNDIYPDYRFMAVANHFLADQAAAVLEKYRHLYYCTMKAELEIPAGASAGVRPQTYHQDCNFFEDAVKTCADLCRASVAGQPSNWDDKRLIQCSIFDALDEVPILTVEQILDTTGMRAGYKLRVNDDKITPREMVTVAFQFDGLVLDTGLRLDMEIIKGFDLPPPNTPDANKRFRLRNKGSH